MPVAPTLFGAATQALGQVSELSPLKLLRGQDDPVRFQDNARRALDAVSQNALLNSRLVTLVTPNDPTQSVDVQHGLGRAPVAFIVAQSPNGCVVSVVGGDRNPAQSSKLTFSTTNVTVVLWIW